VMITVADTGTGMPRQVLERAFEPLYTTKPVGRGNGLGLTMVHGFAVRSHGHVRVHSTPGKGTRIDLCLPAISEAPSPEPAP
jgi:signal transduction histidine kinase